MQKPRRVWRHGDVVVEVIDTLPELGAEVLRDPDGAVVFARGEATGQRHFVRDRDVRLFDLAGDPTVRICRVGAGGGVLRHEEHGDIALPPGDYRVSIKRQYSPDGGWDPVAD